MKYSQLKSDILEKFLEAIEKSPLVYRFPPFKIKRLLFGGFCFYQFGSSPFFCDAVFTFKIKKDKLLIKCKDIILSNKLQVYCPTNKKLEIDLPKSSEDFTDFYSIELPELILGNYSDVDTLKFNPRSTLFDVYITDYNIQQEATRFWNFCLENHPSYMGTPNNRFSNGVFIDSSNQNILRFELLAESQKRMVELLREMKEEEEELEKQKLMGEEVF